MYHAIGLLFASVLFYVIYYIITDRRQAQKFAHIPGPASLPIIGSLHILDRVKPFNSFTEWSQKYGPVIKVKTFAQTCVVANGYEAIREMLVDKGVEFGGRPRGFRDSITAHSTGLLRMDANDKKFRTIRRLIQSSVKAFGSGINRIQHYAMETSSEFIQVFADTQGKPIDPLGPMYDATVRMISLMLYGRKLERSHPIFNEIKSYVSELDAASHPGGDGPLLDMFPWLRFFGNESYKLCLRVRKRVETIDQWYHDDVAPVEDSELDDKLGKPLYKMLRDHNKNLSLDHEEYLPPDMVLSTMFHVTFAGVISTSQTLYAGLLALLHDHHVQQKLQKEIDDILGDRTVTVADRDKMPYVNAFIYEVLRYSVMGPLAIPHCSTSDATLQGYHVPKGTLMYPNLWSLHKDEKFWGDPHTFRPERFLDDKGQLLPSDHDVRHHFMMFGNGARLCAGRLFGLYRLFLWVTTLVQRFDILPEDPDNLPSNDVRTFVNYGVSLRVPTYKVRFIARQ